MEGIAFIRMCLELWDDEKLDCNQELIHVEDEGMQGYWERQIWNDADFGQSSIQDEHKICWGRLRGRVYIVEKEITDFQGVECGRSRYESL